MASAYNDSQTSIQNMAHPAPSQSVVPQQHQQTSSTIPSAQGAGGLVGAVGIVPGTTTAVATTEPSSASTSATGATAAGGGGGEPDPTELAAAETERQREALEKKLQELIQSLLELSITVYDFQAESNSLVHQKM
ncbi:hypothetical protein BGZ97_004649 [Linnemannia gamsii]|jgi:hypothetical protein|uniref:Uncharacterized protein n=1 Tax=Linnemannia gamsii TaxID=64522 RepID=A0A9P6QTE8_9FUNG|nr:hypothetical protein BGZ97_004649 [Linnemannia gamsii]